MNPGEPVASAPPSVSVIIPVLNEARTVSRLVRHIRRSPQVVEIIVVDDGSTDGTPEIASRAGARVITSTLLGKGASMEDGLAVATGDIVLFLDGDLLQICDDLVERMTTPILTGQADLVKARFSRDAGRVTVLTARPLLAAFFPELAGFEQPLGGIVAARRSLLTDLPLENDYGVDIGLLIDAAGNGARVVEVDIGRIDHESQSLDALGDMARQITRAILDRAWRRGRLSIELVREMEEAERRHRADLLPAGHQVGSEKKVALFDMDGVLLDGRYVVELAGRLGVQQELQQFLDNESLSDEERTRGIAALFAGAQQEVFEDTARSMPLMTGAVETVVALRKAGYLVGVVTDSFQIAAQIVRRRVFADFSVAHMLHFHNRLATGEVTISPMMLDPDGCKWHSCCKSNVLRHLRDSTGFAFGGTLAVGDNDNDICMLGEVDTSIAFRPKSTAVAEAAKYSVSNSLTEVLDLLDLSAGVPCVQRRPHIERPRLALPRKPVRLRRCLLVASQTAPSMLAEVKRPRSGWSLSLRRWLRRRTFRGFSQQSTDKASSMRRCAGCSCPQCSWCICAPES